MLSPIICQILSKENLESSFCYEEIKPIPYVMSLKMQMCPQRK